MGEPDPSLWCTHVIVATVQLSCRVWENYDSDSLLFLFFCLFIDLTVVPPDWATEIVLY